MMLERICFSVLESSLVASVLYALMMLASCLSSSAQRLKKRLIALFLPVGLNGRPLVLFAAVLMMLGIYIA